MSTNNAVNVGLSGSTGTGNFVGATSPTLVTPTLGAATATSISFSSTSGIIGSTTNDSAAAGSVGQYISSNIANLSAVTLSHTAASNITSISLSAGDWEVGGNVVVAAANATTNGIIGWCSTTSATQPDASNCAATYNTVAIINSGCGVTVPTIRLSLSTTTTVYLSAALQDSTSNATGCGNIWGRRVR